MSYVKQFLKILCLSDDLKFRFRVHDKGSKMSELRKKIQKIFYPSPVPRFEKFVSRTFL